jgi:hypothetical protein
MSTILVIEPRKILQHATAIALFPEYEARMAETISQAEGLTGFDAVIVDAAALRDRGALSPQTISAMEDWKAPMIWIDGDQPQSPKRDKLVIIKGPVSRSTIRAALAQCLEQKSPLTPGSAANTNEKRTAAAKATQQRVIELVDVVEEGPTVKRRRREKNKKK